MTPEKTIPHFPALQDLKEEYKALFEIGGTTPRDEMDLLISCLEQKGLCEIGRWTTEPQGDILLLRDGTEDYTYGGHTAKHDINQVYNCIMNVYGAYEAPAAINFIPDYIIGRESRILPGCETIIDCKTGAIGKILRFDAKSSYYDRYVTKGVSGVYHCIQGYMIVIEWLGSIDTYRRFGIADQMASVIGMANFLENVIEEKPHKFKKYMTDLNKHMAK